MSASRPLLAIIAPAHATATTITPSNADTSLSEGNANTNYGPDTNIAVEADLGVTSIRGLVKFDLSSIPPGISTINTASLQLYYWSTVAGNPVNRIYTANRAITNNWGETTATWNKYDGALVWGTAGGDFTTTGAASQTVGVFGWMTWDVTAIVKAWIESGQPNYGFLIKDANEGVGTGGGKGANFYSREATDPNKPILTVDYTVRTAVIPEYPIGLPLLAIFMIIAYGLIKRRTRNPKNI